MNHAEAVSRAREISETVLKKNAESWDREARFPTEAIAQLGKVGLLAMTVPTSQGGSGLGPRTLFEVVSALAENDPSTAMIYVMHICGTACILAAPESQQKHFTQTIADIVAGKHLTTLAFSEKGSRSHFWAPVSKATKSGSGVTVNAFKSFVTSAGEANSYVVSTLSHDGTGPMDTTLYLMKNGANGARIASKWDGMGLRANASAPMSLEGVTFTDADRLTDEKAGLKAMLEVVLPFFNLGGASMSLGICRTAVSATINHLKAARFEHLKVSLGEALPTLRATLAHMQIDRDKLESFLNDVVTQMEAGSPTAMLRVLESKAAAGDTAIETVSKAMLVGGGAAFSKQSQLERLFRDAHASAVMAPTGDVLRDLIGKALLGLPLL